MANWKGGMLDTGLKSGNDGLSDVKSHVSTFKGLEGTVHVGREDTIGSSTEPGGGENKGRGGGEAENQCRD